MTKTKTKKGQNKMAHINETITINPSEGLEIDISRIEFADVSDKARPSWTRVNFSYSNLAEDFPPCGKYIILTEDDLETVIRKWLEHIFNCGIRSFRWVWDKCRTYNAA